MIYPAESDIVPFIKSLAQALQSYAQANEVHISFLPGIKKQLVHYQPFLLSQSLVQLTCNIINLLPPKSRITVRLLCGNDDEHLYVEVENTGINLIRVNELCTQDIYSFTGYPLKNGTIYRLVLPLHARPGAPDLLSPVNISTNKLPQFYKEIQKRLRTHFTQTEKLIAALEQKRPQEAAFMQKINALINANLENDNFDTNALCKAMSLSRTQLFRRLKSLIKKAPAYHIKNMRLQKAKELLETTDWTVSEVTFKTGFQSISHFTKIFKKKYGILPSVFSRTNNKPATNE